MTVHNLYSGSWSSNCYVILSNGQDGITHAAVIDPSAPAEKITDFLLLHDARLEMIILTHGHFDHIMSLDTLRDATGAPAYVHEDDAEMLSDSMKNAYSFFFGDELVQRPADKTLSDGELLVLGDEKIKVFHLPGHSKGSIALQSGQLLITGDTLFDGGIGRCDLYGGNSIQLYASLGKLRELDGELIIYPGHGGSTKLSHALDSIF